MFTISHQMLIGSKIDRAIDILCLQHNHVSLCWRNTKCFRHHGCQPRVVFNLTNFPEMSVILFFHGKCFISWDQEIRSKIWTEPEINWKASDSPAFSWKIQNKLFVYTSAMKQQKNGTVRIYSFICLPCIDATLKWMPHLGLMHLLMVCTKMGGGEAPLGIWLQNAPPEKGFWHR